MLALKEVLQKAEVRHRMNADCPPAAWEVTAKGGSCEIRLLRLQLPWPAQTSVLCPMVEDILKTQKNEDSLRGGMAATPVFLRQLFKQRSSEFLFVPCSPFGAKLRMLQLSFSKLLPPLKRKTQRQRGASYRNVSVTIPTQIMARILLYYWWRGLLGS